MRNLKWESAPIYSERLTTYVRGVSSTPSSGCLETLRREDTRSRHLLFRLSPSARPTGATGCGSLPDVLPTPVSSDKNGGLHKGGYEVSRSGAVVSVEGHYKPGLVKMAQLQILPTPTSCNVVHPSAEAELTEDGNIRRVRADGTPFTLGLADLAHRGVLPTPRASDADKGMRRGYVVKGGSVRSESGMTAGLAEEARLGLLPTPRATNSKGGSARSDPRFRDTNLACLLHARYHAPGSRTSRLNPLYVAEMMGFPLDWLVLPFTEGGRQSG